MSLATSVVPSCAPSATQNCSGIPSVPSTPAQGRAPSARLFPAIGSEPSGPLVLYGGEKDDGSPLFDTWLWNGHTWSANRPGSGPFLYSPLMAFDRARQQLLLVGAGRTASIGPLRPETWTWDRGSWKQVHTSTTPPSYTGGWLAYDGSTHHVLLYAGIRDTDVTHQELWSWDGKDWIRLASWPEQATDMGPILITAAPGNHAVGLGFNQRPGHEKEGAIYTWAGTDWKSNDVAGTPRYFTTAAYDPERSHLVVIGIRAVDAQGTLQGPDTTFIFDGNRWSATPLPMDLQGRVTPYLAWYGTACTLAWWGGVRVQGTDLATMTSTDYTDTWYQSGSTWVKVAG